ncbi:RNA demethylase ALKBH10B-like isoform X1 [Solanum lycopersicum]|uniref:RNA demethylase ALKBH10B-like isoform X1 n=1 Tax=Solanum lycopersicum TaxID=4081 RepID=UPI000276B9C5|nr:uncharacterized protein LOC101258968 isoform X1 [Solanum lycopersicum]
MPPAADVVGHHRVVPLDSKVTPTASMVSETFAKDAILAWFRGEFAAANAIIDALCNHITQLEGGRAEHESVFAAIHRRRLNWIPILQMQKYCSIAEVTLDLRKVADRKIKEREEFAISKQFDNQAITPEIVDGDDSPETDITHDTGLLIQHLEESVEFCSNHENCEARHAHIKMTKGFVSKELVKGHMVNVVRGLKLFEDIFTPNEISKLNDLVDELRVAGQNGDLSGETFILFNQQVKGNKREMIQLGTPIFGHIKEEAMCQKSNIEPIPALLQGVIDHLIQWNLISESRRPNSCVINYFDEGEYSQPFMKPPHLDQPVSTLLLSESMMAFGRALVSDSDGNYKGSFMLSLKQGSLLVMRGNSADMARHALCSSASKRVAITFFKVRTEMNNFVSDQKIPPLTKAMTLWQPGVPTHYSTANGAANGYKIMDVMPKWGFLRAPEFMVAPVHPMVLSPRKIPTGGTGVFLPLSRKPAKHIPPRAQKRRFLELPSPSGSPKSVSSSEASTAV